ncbi:MAG: serine/threonine protein kinase [Rubripirellula sp.]
MPSSGSHRKHGVRDHQRLPDGETELSNESTEAADDDRKPANDYQLETQGDDDPLATNYDFDISDPESDTFVTSLGDFSPPPADSLPPASKNDSKRRRAPLATYGNYETIRRIGRGGMGEVFLARHLQFKQRLYALKLIRASRTSPKARERFEQEIQAMGGLSHPNVVFASDAGVDGDEMYLVMEYVAGADLQRRVSQEGPFSAGNAAEIIRQVALGLQHAHAAHIIHRDVKPSNIIVSDRGVAKLLDLGVASLQGGSSHVTNDGDLVGTAPFLAPELWHDARLANAQSDLYALGCTAYLLLTGNAPFNQLDHVSLPQLMQAHHHQPPTPLDQINPHVPRSFAAVVEQTLAKDPNDRPASALQFASDLEPFCETLPIRVTEDVHTEESENRTGDHPSHDYSTNGHSTNGHSTGGHSGTESVEGKRWTRNVTQPKPILARIVTVTTTLTLVASISLAMAYFGPMSTPTWQLRFDRLGDPAVHRGVGFSIELLRAWLYVSLTVLILGTQFTREIRTFFDYRNWGRSVCMLRIVILVVIGAFVVMEGTRQLTVSRAPASLAQWGLDHGIQTTPEAEAVPYRPYLIYSLNNYIVVMGGLFAFPAIRFWFSDLRYILMQLSNLKRRQSTQSNGGRLTANLHRFGTELRQMTGRYFSILGVLAIGAHYDYWIGSMTLTDEGQNTMLMGMAIACSALAFVLVVAYIFFCGFDCTRRRVQTLDDERRLSQIDTIWFLKTTLLYNLGGLACISLLGLIAHAVIT